MVETQPMINGEICSQHNILYYVTLAKNACLSKDNILKMLREK